MTARLESAALSVPLGMPAKTKQVSRERSANDDDPPADSPEARRSHVLVVDDEPEILRAAKRVLTARGYDVTTAQNGQEAVRCLAERSFDAIVSDIVMPGSGGIDLLREVREHDLLVPVVLVTGEPAVSTAVLALEYGAFHYLTKPVDPEALERVIAKAVRMHRMARVKQQAAELLGHASALGADRAGLEASFERAAHSFWMAYHPIVDLRKRTVYGYEALLRSEEPSLPTPTAVLDAAARLDRLDFLGREIRGRVAAEFSALPAECCLFVNLHVTDLLDPHLTASESPLCKLANRVVLEITERSSLDEVKDVRMRIAALREIGFRIAVDDLGAGYAGLTSFTLLEPEIVKFDMKLVRDVHKNPTKQKVIRSMTSLAKDMGMIVIAEGVESADERDMLLELDCDLLQGFLFAKPRMPIPDIDW